MPGRIMKAKSTNVYQDVMKYNSLRKVAKIHNCTPEYVRGLCKVIDPDFTMKTIKIINKERRDKAIYERNKRQLQQYNDNVIISMDAKLSKCVLYSLNRKITIAKLDEHFNRTNFQRPRTPLQKAHYSSLFGKLTLSTDVTKYVNYSINNKLNIIPHPDFTVINMEGFDEWKSNYTKKQY